ncbi:MAG: hypothetical protein QOJ25_2509 [Solirubrobacteraceae bacterium]|nr:hypothetical protein [Solirubrobacteraceae bacterium]
MRGVLRMHRHRGCRESCLGQPFLSWMSRRASSQSSLASATVIDWRCFVAVARDPAPAGGKLGGRAAFCPIFDENAGPLQRPRTDRRAPRDRRTRRRRERLALLGPADRPGVGAAAPAGEGGARGGAGRTGLCGVCCETLEIRSKRSTGSAARPRGAETARHSRRGVVRTLSGWPKVTPGAQTA